MPNRWMIRWVCVNQWADNQIKNKIALILPSVTSTKRLAFAMHVVLLQHEATPRDGEPPYVANLARFGSGRTGSRKVRRINSGYYHLGSNNLFLQANIAFDVRVEEISEGVQNLHWYEHVYPVKIDPLAPVPVSRMMFDTVENKVKVMEPPALRPDLDFTPRR